MQFFIRLYQEKPVKLILLLALSIRLIAAFFSKGWGMHDDHFLVIEPAQAWVDGTNYNNWLPAFSDNAVPSGHSLFYPGLHYLLFSFLNALGITDPNVKMLIVRLLHALFSLLTVWFGYKIAEVLGGKKIAGKVGLLLALFWFLPFLSVRNLVEMVCIPFLMAGIWLLIKPETRRRTAGIVFLAGLIMGIGFSVRFQTMAFSAGAGLALLLEKRWRDTIIFGLGYLLSIVLIQGSIDYAIWQKPFAEFAEYFSYNLNNATEYIVSAWYTYLILILGILVPPVSLMIMSGWVISWRKHLLVFLPAFFFLVFHSIFPNKQERFILPIIPFIIISGIAGWEAFAERSGFWKNRANWIKYSWIVFWSLNTLALIPVSTMYTKKARVESMRYLSKYQDIRYLLLDSSTGSVKYPPCFYLEQWIKVIVLDENLSIEKFGENLANQDSTLHPRFVLFFKDGNENQRREALLKAMPGLAFETTIEPGYMDKLLYWLNPVNANQTIEIYRNTNFYKEKL